MFAGWLFLIVIIHTDHQTNFADQYITDGRDGLLDVFAILRIFVGKEYYDYL